MGLRPRLAAAHGGARVPRRRTSSPTPVSVPDDDDARSLHASTAASAAPARSTSSSASAADNRHAQPRRPLRHRRADGSRRRARRARRGRPLRDRHRRATGSPTTSGRIGPSTCGGRRPPRFAQANPRDAASARGHRLRRHGSALGHTDFPRSQPQRSTAAAPSRTRTTGPAGAITRSTTSARPRDERPLPRRTPSRTSRRGRMSGAAPSPPRAPALPPPRRGRGRPSRCAVVDDEETRPFVLAISWSAASGARVAVHREEPLGDDRPRAGTWPASASATPNAADVRVCHDPPRRAPRAADRR